MGVAETSGIAENDCTDDYSTEGADSQAESLINEAKKGSRGAGRTRNYAIVVYPDSAPDDWRERLSDEHVQALISPLHDKDCNPDGSQKKPHYHVMVMYDSVKTQEQVDELWDRVLGPNRVKRYEVVNSTRGYARYLCHKDNPEKAQYSDEDVIALGGADYEDLIQLATDDRSTLRMVFAYIREHGIRYYDELIDACMEDGLHSMFALITEKRTLAVTNYLKARVWRGREQQRDEDESRDAIPVPEDVKNLQALERVRAMGLLVLEPETGELLDDGKELNDDSQD